MKLNLLYYWRFVRKFNLIGSEVNTVRFPYSYRKKIGKKWTPSSFKSDILVTDGKIVIECEVKGTKSDLEKDFVFKALKHEAYKDAAKYKKETQIPNKMYFAIPEKLKEVTLELLKGTPYGVLLISKKVPNKQSVTIIKKAKTLHKCVPKKLIHNLELRSSSELVRAYLKIQGSNK